MNNKFTLCLLVFLSLPFSLIYAQKNPYQIGITTQSFIPAEKNLKDLIPPTHSDQLFDGKYFKLIQFYQTPSEFLQRNLQHKGMQLVDYLPGKAFFAVIDQEFDYTPFVDKIRAVINLDEKFKLESEIYHHGFPLHAFEEEGAKLNLVISYYDGLEISNVVNAIREFGEIQNHIMYARQIFIQVEPKDFSKIIDAPYVQFVGVPDAEPELEANYWQGNGRGNFLSSGFNGYDFNGDGVTICVSEGGTVDFQNLNYKGRSTELSGGNNGGHKVGVSLRQAGAGNTRPTDRGVAWGADFVSASGTSYENYFNNNSVRFTNHSYGWGVGGGYNSGARNRDLFVTNYPEGSVLYSAGNNGGSTGYSPYNSFSGWANITGATKQGKNYFTCASVNRYDSPSGFSSLGPAYDGRLFPQITVEGAGGTSHAAPKTTGSMGVLSEVYTHYHSSEAPSSLLKAILLNTADDIHNVGPDFKTGYGRINLRRAHNLIEANQIITSSISNNGNNQHVINVPVNTAELKVMVYWRDEAASVNANPALVNDLDIKLTDPASTEFLPWVLDHTPDPALLNNPATRGVDHLNNMEQVTIDNPVMGAYTLDVDGFNIPSGPQEYFVVYEFVPIELQITYPINNDHFVPGVNEIIYWDSYGGSTSDFILEYQIDGGTWTSIGTADFDERSYQWSPPSISGVKTMKVRITQDGSSSESSNGFIGNKPGSVHFDWTCGSTIKLDWSNVSGATSYVVYQLGAKYMKPITSNITFDGSSATISGIDVNETHLFAVATVESGRESLRSDGVFYTPDPAENFETTVSSTIASCDPGNDGTATISPTLSGTYTYAWSNGGNTSTITGLVPGTYTATVTNAGNCTASKSVMVTGTVAGDPCDDGNAATTNDVYDNNCNCAGTPIDIGCGLGIDFVNAAIGKPTTQSSTGFGGSSSRAVDNNTDGDWGNNSVTHTNNTSANNWWEVNLENNEDIQKINLWNRTDCCSDRLENFYVFVSPTPFTSEDPSVLSNDPEIWNTFISNSPSPNMSVDINAPGQYVRIQLTDNDYLSLAEVEVLVCPLAPLPVELGSFTVKKYDESSAQLNWSTYSELNNQGFHIERSKDATAWERISFIGGQGTSNLQNNYQFLDKDVLTGWNYYRLAQEDIDGTITFSSVQTVFFERKDILIYPNPTQNNLNIILNNPDREVETFVEMYNNLGQIVFRKSITSDRTIIDLKSYSSGSYTLRMSINGEWIYRVIVKE